MPIPAVTVLIDTYNHERFIEQALASVFDQDFPVSEIEILVVDDGSTDRTPEILQRFAPRVRILSKQNGGQASAFNAGIPECRGEIVAFLDGDDWWAKDKLTTVAEYLSAHPHIGIVGHGIYEIDDSSHEMKSTIPQAVREMRFDTVAGGKFFRQMMCFFGTSRVTIRRKVLDRVLPIPESLVVEADEFMSFMSAAYSAAGLIQQPLTYYRLHANNLFQTRDRDDVKQRRIQRVLAALARELRPRLAAASINEDVIQTIVEPLDVTSTRMRLMLDGGTPLETFRAERAEFRLAYGKSSAAYSLFKWFVLACTLGLPPKTFYRVRQWYGDSGLRKLRGILGEPVMNAKIANVPVSTGHDTPGRADAI